MLDPGWAEQIIKQLITKGGKMIFDDENTGGAPEEQPQEEAAPAEQPQEEAAPEEQPQEEAAPEDAPAEGGDETPAA